MAEAAGGTRGAGAGLSPVRELIVYFALAYAITFGLGVAFIFFRPQFEALFGHFRSPATGWPYFVAVSAPTISAVAVSFAFGGWNGITRLFSGLVRPFRVRWAFAALLAFPTGLLLWAFAARALSGSQFHAIDAHAVLVSPFLWFTTPLIFIDPGPWGEETGWRGFALPRLLTRLSPLSAGIVLGVIWTLWHTPAFFVSGLAQFGLNFLWFMLAGTCLSIFMTWIYVNANRNYFVAGFIPHAVSNLLFTAHIYSDIKIETILFVAIALVLVAAFGPSLKGWRVLRTAPAEA
jgi:membrane protease YdiL (CAAX protease family)